VKADFRQRLFDALEASIAEDGYSRTTIADVVRRARTSRRTFYEHFASKEECFIALLTEANVDQIRRITAAVEPSAPWQDQARQAIEAWVASIEARPTLMLSWIRDVPALGAIARQLQRDAMGNFVAMVQGMVASEGFSAAGIGQVPQTRIIMLLGGLRELTAVTVENGGRLGDVADEVVDAAIALIGPPR
jgi:AcrR family transcriptional regulator